MPTRHNDLCNKDNLAIWSKYHVHFDRSRSTRLVAEPQQNQDTWRHVYADFPSWSPGSPTGSTILSSSLAHCLPVHCGLDLSRGALQRSSKSKLPRLHREGELAWSLRPATLTRSNIFSRNWRWLFRMLSSRAWAWRPFQLVVSSFSSFLKAHLAPLEHDTFDAHRLQSPNVPFP